MSIKISIPFNRYRNEKIHNTPFFLDRYRHERTERIVASIAIMKSILYVFSFTTVMLSATHAMIEKKNPK